MDPRRGTLELYSCTRMFPNSYMPPGHRGNPIAAHRQGDTIVVYLEYQTKFLTWRKLNERTAPYYNVGREILSEKDASTIRGRMKTMHFL